MARVEIQILIGAGAAVLIVMFAVRGLRRKKKRRLREEVFFGLYVNLMETYGYYYWVVMGTASEDDPAIQEKMKTLRNMISNQSSELQNASIYQDIFDLFNKNALRPRELYKGCGELVERLGRYIEKYYPKVARRIEAMGFEAGKIVNAPGFLDWVPTSKKKW
ncbi:MAG: hypothetical protein LBL26_14525 [Peptococcaceae bacterium]|jgi:hypothetical protein|nr:hypothetical protein [Peptococcaceae bacterium]